MEFDNRDKLYLELEDGEWPFTYTDHDREIVRAIVFDKDGFFYFVRVERDDMFGKATLIETSGGGVEEKEDFEDAIRRELSEELGASVRVVAEIGLVSDYYNLIHRHNLNHYYLCEAVSFGEKHLMPDEIDDFHLSTLKRTYEEAVREYERCACTPLGRLLANRELPVLRRGKVLLDLLNGVATEKGRKVFRIETERLLITEFSPDMAEDVHRNSLDEDNRRFVPDEVFETVSEARETISFLISRYGGTEGPFVYPVLLKDGGKNIGYVQLIPLQDGKWEIGYHIAKAYTGNGYATEAVRAFLPEAARMAGTESVYGICLSDNAASVRVLRKCGFSKEYKGTGTYLNGKQEICRSVWYMPDESRG